MFIRATCWLLATAVASTLCHAADLGAGERTLARRWQASARVSLGYDDNASLATDDTASQTSRTASTWGSVGLSGAYRFRAHRRWHTFLDGSIASTGYAQSQAHDFRFTSATAR